MNQLNKEAYVNPHSRRNRQVNTTAPMIIAAAVLAALSTAQSTVASAQNAAKDSATIACAPQTESGKRAQKFVENFNEMEKANFSAAWTRGIDGMLKNDTLSRKCAPEAFHSARTTNEGQEPRAATTSRTAR